MDSRNGRDGTDGKKPNLNLAERLQLKRRRKRTQFFFCLFGEFQRPSQSESSGLCGWKFVCVCSKELKLKLFKEEDQSEKSISREVKKVSIFGFWRERVNYHFKLWWVKFCVSRGNSWIFDEKVKKDVSFLKEVFRGVQNFQVEMFRNPTGLQRKGDWVIFEGREEIEKITFR